MTLKRGELSTILRQIRELDPTKHGVIYPHPAHPSRHVKLTPRAKAHVASNSLGPEGKIAVYKLEIEQLDRKIEAALERRARLTLALERARIPARTPYGRWLHGYDAESVLLRFADPQLNRNHTAGIIEERILKNLQRVFQEEFPVYPRPGEALWIAEREYFKDLDVCSYSDRLFLYLEYLGADRLAEELPAERLARLKVEHPQAFE